MAVCYICFEEGGRDYMLVHKEVRFEGDGLVIEIAKDADARVACRIKTDGWYVRATPVPWKDLSRLAMIIRKEEVTLSVNGTALSLERDHVPMDGVEGITTVLLDLERGVPSMVIHQFLPGKDTHQVLCHNPEIDVRTIQGLRIYFTPTAPEEEE